MGNSGASEESGLGRKGWGGVGLVKVGVGQGQKSDRQRGAKDNGWERKADVKAQENRSSQLEPAPGLVLFSGLTLHI